MFPPSFDIGISQATASFVPFTDGSVGAVFSFQFPEYLSLNDSIVIRLDGFSAIQSSLYVPSYADNPSLSLYWDGATSSMNISLVKAVVSRSQTVDLRNFITLYSPLSGVSSETISFSLFSLLNGDVNNAPFTNVSNICGFIYVSIYYAKNSPGAPSGLSLQFEIGGSPLAFGDRVSFALGGYDGFSRTATINTSLFQVSFNAGNLTLQANGPFQASSYYSMTLSPNLGFTVPSSGIRATDRVNGIIISKTCQMVASQAFAYAALITSVQNASLSVLPSAASIGDKVNVTLGFNYSRNFSAGDVIVLHIPYLFRDIYLLHEVNLTSALPIMATYERSTGSVVMVFGGNFSLPSSPTYLTVDFLENAGFSVPVTGLPSSSSTMSIASVYGNMDPVVLPNPCVGVCSFSALYSTEFTQTLLDISLTTEFSARIYAGINVSLELRGYGQGTSGIGVSISNESSATSKFTVYATGNPSIINFTMPFNVDPLTVLTIIVTDTSFPTAGTLSGPTLLIIDSSLYPNQTVVVDFPPPTTVYSVPQIQNASLTLFDLVAGQASRVSFSFIAVHGIDNSTSIRLMLPQYSTTGTLSSLNSSIISLSSFHSSQNILTFDVQLLSYIAPGSLWEVIIDGLVTPNQGTSTTNQSLDASFAIGVAPNVFSPFQPLVQSAVDAVYGVSVVFGTNASFQLTSINITFTVNFAVNTGDSVNCTISGLVGYATLPLQLAHASANVSATWIPGSSSVQIVFLSSSNATSFSFAVNAVNGANRIGIASQGFSGNSLGTLNFLRGAQSSSISTTFSIPCFGICSATCAIGIPKAGFPSDYTFTMTFGGREFSYGDKITMYLAGFTKNASSVITTNIPSMASIWDASASSLSVSASASFQSTFNLTFVVSADQSIALPPTGIRVSNAFVVTWSTSSGSVLCSNTILVFSSVGYANVSNLVVAPRVAGAVGTYNFTVSFLDELHSGDVMLIGLIGATILFGPLDHFVANHNISAIGIPASNTDFISIFHTSTLLLTVHEAIAAGSTITFYVPSSANVALPNQGFNSFNAPELALVSPYSPVTTTNFILFSVVGSFKPASLVLSGQDIFLSFNAQCALESRAQLVVYLPNAVGQDQLIAISTNLGVSAVSSGVYSSATSSVIFTFLQTIPVNTVMNITLHASGLQFSNKIQYANDNDAAYKFISTSCGCDMTGFDYSNSYLFVNSSVAFSVPVTNRNTNVTVALLPAENVAIGDFFSFELPNLGNTTGNSSPAVSLSGGNSSAFAIQGFFFGGNRTAYINVTVLNNIPANSVVSLNLISSSFYIPSVGVPVGAVYPLSWLRPSNSPGVQVIAVGQFNAVERVASFISKSVVVTNPLPGAASGLIFNWQLSSMIDIGDAIVFRLPGFSYGGLSPNSVPAVGALAPYVSCSWNPASQILSVAFLR